MTRTLFENVSVWTAGEAPFRADVLVQADVIAAIARDGQGIQAADAFVIDGAGATLMPGLIDGHAHLPFPDHEPNLLLWSLIPPEEHTLLTMHNARRVLDAGFTSVISGGCVKPRLDAVIRDEIAAGRIPGPRIQASTPEFTVTGGLGDDRRVHMDVHTFCQVMDGPEAFRSNTRLHLREGADVIKVCVSGHQPTPGGRHAGQQQTLVTEAELKAVVETAKAFGKKTSAHARSDAAVELCLRVGVDILYHCEYVTTATLDLLEAARDRVVLAPAAAPFIRSLENASAAVQLYDLRGLEEQFERVCATYQALRKRGVRVMIGGEYGLAHCPHGTNARDIEYFTRYFGYDPAEALACATRVGAQGMDADDRLGQVKAGYLADLLLVRGDPLADVRLLQDPQCLLAIMQGGRLHKLAAPGRSATSAAA